MPTIEELLSMTEGVTEKQDALEKLAETQVTGTNFRQPGDSWHKGLTGKGTMDQTRAMVAMLSNPKKQGQTGIQALGEGFEKGMTLRDNMLEKQGNRKVAAAKLGVQGAQDTLKNQADIYGLEQNEAAGRTAAEQELYDRDQTAQDRGIAADKVKYDAGRDSIKDSQWRAGHGLDLQKHAQEVESLKKQEGAAAAKAYEEAVLIQDDIMGLEQTLGFNTSGATGMALSMVPGRDAYVHNNRIQSLKSKLGLGKLAELRAAAKSGASGMGNLTEKELMVLQDSLGKLDIGLPEDEQRRVMEDISKYYMKAINAWHNLKGPNARDPSDTSGGYDSATGEMGRGKQEGPPRAAPQPGEVVGGFRYKGGNPNSQSSWEAI